MASKPEAPPARGRYVEVAGVPFEVMQHLGDGGYGSVYLAVGPNGERVALKFIRRGAVVPHSRAEKEVVREIQVMSRLRSQFVVQLLAYDLNAEFPGRRPNESAAKHKPGEFYVVFVLELATRGELFELLTYTGAFEERFARLFFMQMVAGLKYCHENHIIHRDIKPENLLISDDFTLKIADFGFSNIFVSESGELLEMQTDYGSRGYKAPEIHLGKPYCASADIFSSGVVLFILLAGFPPFVNAKQGDWWWDALSSGNTELFWHAHERTAEFTPSAKSLIQGMLHPDPKKRFTLSRVISHEWSTKEMIHRRDCGRWLESRFHKASQVGKVGGGLQEAHRASELCETLPPNPPPWRRSDSPNVVGDSSFDPSPSPSDCVGAPAAHLSVMSQERASATDTHLPVFDDSLVVPTAFYTADSAERILSALVEVIGNSKWTVKIVDRTRFALQAQLREKHMVLGATFQLYHHPSSGLNVVHARRVGDCDRLRFMKNFYKLRRDISSRIAFAPPPAVKAAAATSSDAQALFAAAQQQQQEQQQEEQAAAGGASAELESAAAQEAEAGAGMQNVDLEFLPPDMRA